MKKLVLGIALIAIMIPVLTLTGCIRRDLSENNGPITTQIYDNTGFTGVDVGNAFKLEITRGDSYSVEITAGKNLFDKIKVVQTADVLKISMEGWSWNWWWGNTTPKVKITMPDLEKLILSGASNGTVTGFKSNKNLSLKASGASSLDVDMEAGVFTAEISGASNVKGRLTASSSDIELSGASDIDLTGNGGNIRVDASGASTAGLRYYKAVDADVEFSGASNGSLDVSGRLDVNLSGASSLNYYGNPTLGNTSVTGASDLDHKTQ